MEFEGMEAVFGKLKAEVEGMLFLAGGLQNQTDGAILRTFVTDFHANTGGSRYSKTHLEDMRDCIGIGGSWSDFVQYVTASLQTQDVSLVIAPQPKSGGNATAKLVAQKAKGMPRISISLSKLFEAEASEAMATLSLELYNAYQTTRVSLINEEKRCCQLAKAVSSEQIWVLLAYFNGEKGDKMALMKRNNPLLLKLDLQIQLVQSEKNETLQRHIDSLAFSKKQKVQMTNGKANQDDVAIQSSPGKQVAAATKVANRVVPAYRRAKVRGAFLKDDDDEKAGD